MTLLCRLLAFLRATPVIDAVSPPDPPEWERELLRHRGLSEIHKAKADNLAYFAEHRRRTELTACCESSPFRKSVQ